MSKAISHVLVYANGTGEVFNDPEEAMVRFVGSLKDDLPKVQNFIEVQQDDVRVLYDKSTHFNEDASEVLNFDSDMFYILRDYSGTNIVTGINGLKRVFRRDKAYLVICDDRLVNVSKDIYEGYLKGYQSDWINFDGNKLVKRVADDIFTVIISDKNEDGFRTASQSIDLREYRKHELESYLEDSLESLKSDYKGDWKMKLALIIAENCFDDTIKTFTTRLDMLNQSLKSFKIDKKMRI